MSRLDELIAELCPDGVEYKKLIEVTTKIVDGMHSLPKGLSAQGLYPVISAQNINNNLIDMTSNKYADEALFVKENKRTNIQPGDLLLTIVGAIGRTAVVSDQKMLFQRSICVITPNYRIVESWYLKYVLDSTIIQEWMVTNAHGAAQKGLYLKQVGTIKIPVPPLEVQREIVRVLDNYTFLSAELSEKLSEELSARRKQYEYHSDNLFPSLKNKDVCWIELGAVATVTKLAGFEFTKYITYSEEGKVIALRGLNVKNGHLVLDDVKFIDGSDLSMLTRSKLHIGDMLFTYVGTVGQVALVDEEDKYYLAPNVALVRVNKEYLPKYMMYYFLTNKFRSEQINKLLQASSMQNIPMEKIRKFKLPVIEIEEQQQVVTILDQFDHLCNDITVGLPAEINARKKQYEYYRDKLLSFMEKE